MFSEFFIINSTYLQNIYKYDLSSLLKFLNFLEHHFGELNFHWWRQVGSCSASFSQPIRDKKQAQN